MKLEGVQRRLTIFIGESDHHGHTPLATEIVQRAHAAGLAGATVLRGVEGFGASNHVHTTRILSLSDDLPMVVVIIDTPADRWVPPATRRVDHGRTGHRRRRPGRQVRRSAAGMTVWIGLIAAGAVGAPCRYLLDTFVQDHAAGVFPWGTFLINVTGSFALGLITGAALYHAFPTTPKIILGTGFCGAYTTFSTWTFESVRLVEEGALRDALLNAAMSLLVGATAAGAGLALASL